MDGIWWKIKNSRNFSYEKIFGNPTRRFSLRSKPCYNMQTYTIMISKCNLSAKSSGHNWIYNIRMVDPTTWKQSLIYKHFSRDFWPWINFPLMTSCVFCCMTAVHSIFKQPYLSRTQEQSLKCTSQFSFHVSLRQNCSFDHVSN